MSLSLSSWGSEERQLQKPRLPFLGTEVSEVEGRGLEGQGCLPRAWVWQEGTARPSLSLPLCSRALGRQERQAVVSFLPRSPRPGRGLVSSGEERTDSFPTKTERRETLHRRRLPGPVCSSEKHSTPSSSRG